MLITVVVSMFESRSSAYGKKGRNNIHSNNDVVSKAVQLHRNSQQ